MTVVMQRIIPKLKDDELVLQPYIANARMFFEKNIKSELIDIIHDDESLQLAFETWLDIEYSCKMWKPYNGATRRLKFLNTTKQFWFKNKYEI